MENIHKKLDLLSNQTENLTREVREQKILFVRGMKAIQRAFQMVQKVVDCLAENVEDFQELSGTLGNF
jgi:alcohol dehydrogenase YqhD (iron-dependent ADH family)